jgi:hypothetical protein
VVNATPWPVYPRERETVPIVEEAGWTPVQVWTGAENLAPTGIRSPDSAAHCEYIGVHSERNKSSEERNCACVGTHLSPVRVREILTRTSPDFVSGLRFCTLHSRYRFINVGAKCCVLYQGVQERRVFGALLLTKRRHQSVSWVARRRLARYDMSALLTVFTAVLCMLDATCCVTVFSVRLRLAVWLCVQCSIANTCTVLWFVAENWWNRVYCL